MPPSKSRFKPSCIVAFQFSSTCRIFSAVQSGSSEGNGRGNLDLRHMIACKTDVRFPQKNRRFMSIIFLGKTRFVVPSMANILANAPFFVRNHSWARDSSPVGSYVIRIYLSMSNPTLRYMYFRIARVGESCLNRKYIQR